MKNKKIYWKGLEELTNDSEFVKHADKEFAEHLPIKDAYGDNTQQEGTSRRDFLKLMGFSVAAVSLAACETPIKKAIPYLNKPESVDPGIPNYYASTYVDGSDYCAVVVKTREGRPIYIEGNTLSKITQGGVSARAVASIMSLYDMDKSKEPTIDGKPAAWQVIDKEITDKLTAIAAKGGQIRIVTQTNMSPTTKAVLNDFAAKFPNTQVVTYDAVSLSGLLQANKATFGKAIVPSYDFSKAEVIVGIGADFLANWISPIEFSKQYSQTRKIGKDKKTMSRHYQFESLFTVTGGSADYRGLYKPSQEGAVVAELFDLVAKATGGTSVGAAKTGVKFLDKAAKDLAAAKGKALVVSGSNDTNVQILVNGINQMLTNYGTTIDTNKVSFQKQGNDETMKQFVADLKGGKVNGVIFYNSNPVYDYPNGKEIGEAIAKAELSVATADRLHETASKCKYNCPDSHFLESWNDAEPKLGYFSLTQPTIGTIFNTRQVQDSLLKWSGSQVSYLDYLKESWKKNMLGLQNQESEFELFWQRSLHNGVFEPEITAAYQSVLMPATEGEAAAAPTTPDFATAYGEVKKRYKAEASKDLELVIYESTLLGNGSQANNPYLHDTPDPMTKTCWGNYLLVSQSLAKEKGFMTKEGKSTVASLKIGGADFTLPVVVQPGQAPNTVALALGYGRQNAGKVAQEAAGINMFAFAAQNGVLNYAQIGGIQISEAEAWTKIAQTQTHQTFMGRETIIQESVLPLYQKDDKAGRYFPRIATSQGMKRPEDISLWDISSDGYQAEEKEKSDYEKSLWKNRSGEVSDVHLYPDHHWGLAIDLNTCTGCSACVTACHIENNVPVVGRQEVINRREMHWMRIDRYYSSDSVDSYSAMELAADNPEVVFQPMMCQHCNNAPCETVCPFAATTHSSEGLNQMTYNRCAGTKYCANNCPYKVRRFNWFKYFNNDEFNYHMNNDLGKMVLNPDVTVRSRGVMEKCSMCIQRIQLGKLKSKMEGRRVEDSDVNTACASACPSNAIVFGDLNNPESAISKLLDHEVKSRAYNVLSEVGTKPNVWYLTKIRNKDEDKA